MDDPGFAYEVHKDGKVFLLYHGKLVRSLDGDKATKCISQAEDAGDTEAQLIMAKITGNFKRGNEKQSAKRSRR